MLSGYADFFVSAAQEEAYCYRMQSRALGRERLEHVVFEATAWCALLAATAAIGVLLYLVLSAWGLADAIGPPQDLLN